MSIVYERQISRSGSNWLSQLMISSILNWMISSRDLCKSINKAKINISNLSSISKIGSNIFRTTLNKKSTKWLKTNSNPWSIKISIQLNNLWNKPHHMLNSMIKNKTLSFKISTNSSSTFHKPMTISPKIFPL